MTEHKLGIHRLYCGDSTKMDSVIESANADIIVYDPPYDIDGIYTHIPSPKKGQALVLFYDYKYFSTAIYNAVNTGWNAKFELIWDCGGSVIENGLPLNSHKACAVFGDFEFNNKAATIDGERTGRLKSIEKFNQSLIKKKYGHKHAKPHEWLKAIFKGIGGGVYLDMFAGSGSTLFIAMDSGVKCVLIEKDADLCEKIKDEFLKKMGQ